MEDGANLPGSGAKLITHVKGANHHCRLTGARLGGDLACQPVAPIKAYASQSVRAGGHGHAQGLRRCSWAGVRRAITAKVRSTGCGLTSAWPSAPGKHAPRCLQLPLFSPDKVLFYMVPKRHRQTDGFAVNNRFAEGQCAVCKGQGLPCMPSASCLISSSGSHRKWTRNSVRKSSDRAVAVNEQQLYRELRPTDY